MLLRCSLTSQTTAAEMIFQTLTFQFGQFKCTARNKKHTEQCFLYLTVSESHHKAPLPPSDFLFLTTLTSPWSDTSLQERPRHEAALRGAVQQSRALPFHVYGTLQARQPLDVQLIARLVEKMLVHSQTCAYLHFELAHAWIVSSMDESPKLCLEFPGTHPLYSKDEKVTQMSAIHQTPFPHKFSRIKQKLLRASAQRGPGSLLPSCM